MIPQINVLNPQNNLDKTQEITYLKKLSFMKHLLITAILESI